jgi:hypothetical protein
MVRAWLHLINGAQKYIWIEQQYFLYVFRMVTTQSFCRIFVLQYYQ